MQTIVTLPLLLVGACTTGVSARLAEPAAHVSFAGLTLSDPAGRAELRTRVALAARNFCQRHEDEVTPQALRNDRFDCLERVRSALVADMPRPARTAYREALREAGIRGRRL
jgi:UrcA family protein